MRDRERTCDRELKKTQHQKVLNQNRVIRNIMIRQLKVKLQKRIKNKTILIKNTKGEA